MNNFFLLVLLFLMNLFCFSQNEIQFTWPIDSPRVISGNYGELRTEHFHAGLDFSTNNKLNLPVYSIAVGYVSRIKVSSGGYGKSIYIAHPNGKVSLYAHLNSFSKKIADVTKKQQYAKKNYEIDHKLKPNEIQISAKEIIGLSGNSGSSTGPHLHFEIRDELSETPLNPLEYYEISDNIAPTLQQIAFYNLADTCSPKFLNAYKIKLNKKDSLVLVKDSIILNQGILGFAFSGFDQFIPKGSPNNIFAAKLYFDGKLIYTHELDEINFDETRYVNEYSEVVEKQTFQKCFLPTLYPIGMYENVKNKGRIILLDTNYHNLLLTINDEQGNERCFKFHFKTKKLNYYSKPTINSDVYVNCNKDFMISKNKLQIYVPAKTLYYSTALIFENTIENSGKLIILPTDAHLKSTSIVGFEVPKKYLRNKTKLVLKSGDNVLKPINVGDSVFFSVRNFGWFQLDQDTVAPKIKVLGQTTKQKKVNSITFNLVDNLSGISSYNLFVNEKWILGEYDAKSNLIVYYFDEDTPSGILIFKLEAKDKVGNSNLFEHKILSH
jgi:hypothetical protein